MSLAVEGIEVVRDGRRVLDRVSLEVATDETVAVVGPSGSGKSTLLRAVAGLERPDGGRVLIDGVDATALPPHRRGVGLMFQDDALFPHLDVAANVAFGLRAAGRPEPEIAARTAELLALVGLGTYGTRAVRGLSGGERKRIALARTLAPAPRAILLDEPLGALDRPLHDRLQTEMRAIFVAVGATVILVTHDVGEAFALADRVVVLRDGAVVQSSTPEQLWRAPASGWVARFLGMENVTRRDGRARVVRPDAVVVEPAPEGDGVVLSATRTGPVVELVVTTRTGETLHAATTRPDHPVAGDRVRVTIDGAGVLDLPD